MEEWKDGGVEDWKSGRMGGKVGRNRSSDSRICELVQVLERWSIVQARSAEKI